MADVAFLVFRGRFKSDKRKRSDFDAYDNIGANIIRDSVERSGIDVGFCSPETAHHYKVVLVSFTSQSDYYNFISQVGKLSTWRNRSFVSIVGGAGVLNVAPLRHYIDYCVFGRAENFAPHIVKSALQKKDIHHPSVMSLEGNPYNVIFAQTENVYPHVVELSDGKNFKEKVSGCPLKCRFCTYTYQRKWLGDKAGEYVRDGTGIYQSSGEGLFKESVGMLEENPQSRIITGLDGLSERLRFAMSKRIKNETVVSIFEDASDVMTHKNVYYKLYMVGSYPTESQNDHDEFIENMQRPDPKGKPVQVVVHLTPFQASPLSPGAWLPVNFEKNWREDVAGKDICKKDNYQAWWSRYIESPISQLRAMITMRATNDSDEIINTICFNSKFRQWKAAKQFLALDRKFDLSQYQREYMTSEELPTWYLSSYISDGHMVKMAKHTKKALGIPEKD